MGDRLRGETNTLLSPVSTKDSGLRTAEIDYSDLTCRSAIVRLFYRTGRRQGVDMAATAQSGQVLANAQTIQLQADKLRRGQALPHLGAILFGPPHQFAGDGVRVRVAIGFMIMPHMP